MNQLYLDLCKVKALLVAGEYARGAYQLRRDGACRCITGHIVTACGYDAFQFNTNVFYNDQRVKDCVSALVAEAGLEPESYEVNALFDWNDHPARTKQEVIDLVQRAANRAGGG